MLLYFPEVRHPLDLWPTHHASDFVSNSPGYHQDTPVELGPTAIVPGSQYLLRYDMRPHRVDSAKHEVPMPCHA